MESYKFVDKPTHDNPSAIWSNYTDCQRLIYYSGNNKESARYLLGCDAVDCCTEPQENNQVEFQITNVHSRRQPVVTYNKGDAEVFGHNITTDQWSWKFLGNEFTAHTTGADENLLLHRWDISVFQQDFYQIEFKDFKQIPEDQIAEFDASFNIPQVCLNSHVLQCDDEVNRGNLRPERLELLKRPNLIN